MKPKLGLLFIPLLLASCESSVDQQPVVDEQLALFGGDLTISRAA